MKGCQTRPIPPRFSWACDVLLACLLIGRAGKGKDCGRKARRGRARCRGDANSKVFIRSENEHVIIECFRKHYFMNSKVK